MKQLFLLFTIMMFTSNVWAGCRIEKIITEKEFISYPVFEVKSNLLVQLKANAEVQDMVKNTRATLKNYPEMYKSVSLSSEVILDNNDYLSFILHPGSYMGGAHPNYSSLAYTYSKQTGKRLSAKNFLPGLNKDFVFQGIISGTMTVYASDRKTVLNSNQLLLSEKDIFNPIWDNMVIDSNERIYLVFPIYSLAPYACGTTYVSLLRK